MTRYLCAAVTMDDDLSRRVIEDVLEEQRRAIAVTPGVDLVAILKYALAANRRRVFRDVALLVILLSLVGVVVFVGPGSLTAVIVLLLLIAAWLTVFAERHAKFYGPAARGLRPGRFDPARAPAPVNDAFADEQLKRIDATAKNGNVTVYGAFPPFVGYGAVQSSWSFAVDITRPRRGEQVKPFTVLHVYDHVKARLEDLDLQGVEVSDRLFVNGEDIQGDRRFLPDPADRPVARVDEMVLRQLMADPEESARPYLTVGMAGWQGDLIVCTFVRFLLSRTNLFVEAAHTAVPPLRTGFKSVDELGAAPTAREFFSLVFGSLWNTPGRLLGSIRGVFAALAEDSRRDRKQRRIDQNPNYGALISVREAAADARWQRYFQVFDQARYLKVVEKRIFSSLVEFLRAHNVDASDLAASQEIVVNSKTVNNVDNRTIVRDNARIEAGAFAAGAGAHATGFISRIRGEGRAGSSDGDARDAGK